MKLFPASLIALAALGCGVKAHPHPESGNIGGSGPDPDSGGSTAAPDGPSVPRRSPARA